MLLKYLHELKKDELDVPWLNVDQMEVIRVEVICITSVYTVTLIFVAFNIYKFIILQKRYKNFLITIFYVLSIAVIVARICTSIYYLKYYEYLVTYN